MNNQFCPEVSIRFALPPPELRPFVTTYYRGEIYAPEEESWVEDRLHPEWANLRFHQPGTVQASIGDNPLVGTSNFTVTGPTSRATRFRMASGRSWGIGLMPLGWAKFIGAPADSYADRFVDGAMDEEFVGFCSLAQSLEESNGDFDREVALISKHLAAMLGTKLRNEEAILALNSALIDPAISRVAQVSESTGIGLRTLERLARRHFGFPPKLLLRRQRFLRSLAQFMLDPSLSWLNALDYQYHDQAHFVRDFRYFMGMAPSEYARLDHPILGAAALARAAIAGEAVQGLHDPSSRPK